MDFWYVDVCQTKWGFVFINKFKHFLNNLTTFRNPAGCKNNNIDNKPKYTKTEDITVTKTDPSLLIFGGGNFQMKWAKKQVSNTWTHFHHIFIKM